MGWLTAGVPCLHVSRAGIGSPSFPLSTSLRRWELPVPNPPPLLLICLGSTTGTWCITTTETLCNSCLNTQLAT